MYYGGVYYGQYFPHVSTAQTLVGDAGAVVVTGQDAQFVVTQPQASATGRRVKGSGRLPPRELTREEFVHQQREAETRETRERETATATAIAADDAEMFDIVERMWHHLR